MKTQNILHKISYSALFIALTVILSRFFALPNLFGLSFLKVSFANSVVLFSSFYLGPIWGLIVGGAADVIGATLFPQGGGFNPIFTIPALLTGLFPYIFYKISDKIKIDKKFPTTLTVILSAFLIFLITFLSMNDVVSITKKQTYVFDTPLKITIISLAVGFSLIYIIGAFLIKWKFKDKKINQLYNINSLLTGMFLTYMLVKNPISSVISAYVLNYNFLFVLFTKLLAGFFTCLIHSVIVIVALNLTAHLNMKSALIDEGVFKRIHERREEKKNN